MKNEILILGATGRSGRDVAALLSARGIPLVLAGRSEERLRALQAQLGGTHRLLVGTLESHLRALPHDAPGVVVNTVGPFAETGLVVAKACPPGTHYVDISNEFSATDDILKLDAEAAAAGSVLVTGAGFGVLGTESITLKICAGMPRPASVRVDALATVATHGDTVGSALAGSIVEVIKYGGREVRGGQLVRSATGAHTR